MKRVTGIGGIFFKARDPQILGAWYKKHLGLDIQEWGGVVFPWQEQDGAQTGGMTVWSMCGDEKFAPSERPFMINYRVADLDALLTALREEGCEVVGDSEDSEFGKFGWVMDPEGHKIELWEPPAGQ